MGESENIQIREETEILDKEKPCKKKARTFSVKEFRNNLKRENISNDLQKFHELCFNHTNGHDYALEYLQKGGSCLELLQLMEVHTGVCHLILEIVYFLSLEINSKYPQYIASAHDASKYFLNTYMTMTNKMLSLNSTHGERVAILKFLTAVVALSPNFAKDILIHININTTNLGFLVNTGYSKNAVRKAFINFLMAFLVDGYYPMISALLEKRGLVTGILKGLVHDTADVVCIVMNTLKNQILENPLVSKTVKMRTFSTPVVKDIVQLYNWKGPITVQKDKNGKKKKTEVVVVEVDQHEKSKVNCCVHDFLLVLCTSHKYGVIFKDPQVGLGRKTQNNLVYTVLESFDTPWKHSYASELVVKICGACPDLTKTTWINLKPSLEPRATEQWLCALNFADRLLKELKPDHIQYCIKDLTPHQMAQVTQMLVAPTQILKILTSEAAFNEKFLKYRTLKILAGSIKSIELYLNAVKNATNSELFLTYKNLIKEHIDRNFPNSTTLLLNYKAKDENIDDFEYLNVTFELLSLYQRVCPQLLDFASSSINFRKMLDYTRKISQENAGILEMKIIKLYLNQDPVAFLPNTDLFVQVVPFIIDCYCRLQSEETYLVLEKIFLNSGIFESSEAEIRIWINSLIVVDTCTESIFNLFVSVLKMVFEKSMVYFSQLSDIKNEMPIIKENDDMTNDTIQQLCNEDDINTLRSCSIRHIHLSPFIIALFEYLNSIEIDKILKSYLQYAFLNLLHKQTDPNLFLSVLQKYECDFLSNNVMNYFKAWSDVKSDKILTYHRGKVLTLSKFSVTIMTGDISTFLNTHGDMSKLDISILLDMSVFYVINLAKEGNLSQTLLANSVEYIKFCVENEIEVDPLKHPVLLKYFSPVNINKESGTSALITDFVVDVIRVIKRDDGVLDEYRRKLFNSMRKMFQKSSKYKNFDSTKFMNILNSLNLSSDQCYSILEQTDELAVEDLLNTDNNLSIFALILPYLLNSINNVGKNYQNILNNTTIETISKQISFLMVTNENIDISMFIRAFTRYLETFPHCLDYVHKELFVNIIQKEEYNKDCVELSLLLLKNKLEELIEDIMANAEKVTTKKGVILPILDILSESTKVNEEYLKIIFNKMEPTIAKVLQKPQKAGQHFEKYFKGVNSMIDKFYSIEKCKSFLEKIQKFESTDLFHICLLKTIFKKATNENKKYVNNSILTYIHLAMNILRKRDKSDEDWLKLKSAVDVMKEYFEELPENDDGQFYSQVLQNETFKTFCKFCLKFGLSNNIGLLSTLSVLVVKLRFTCEDSGLMLEMIGSHSEFLDWVLDEDSDCKTEILNLMHQLFRTSDKLMTKQYLPILLAAYRATLRKSDRIILATLKMFEAIPAQTCFYDFKPFLWGKSAANHYSVRSDVQKALWRQPRTGTVLDILEEHWVMNTINKYPLGLSLKSSEFDVVMDEDPSKIYDLTFLLPLFTLLLAPENAVQTYRFTKSGALSLTITALSSEDKDTRSAACFVLARFYHHVEARHTGKDNQLWLRFIEAICKGMAVLDDLKLNRFACVFLARMSLILTQPTHVMYVPLSQYLSAKSVLDFSSIPELYTLLHSPDINFRDHRHFMLEVIRDGLVSSNDFNVALRSVSLKLIMEQYSSVVTDSETKLLILHILERASHINDAVKYLCSNFGLLSWLHRVILGLSKFQNKHLLCSFNILHNIVNSNEKIDFNVVILLLENLVDNSYFKNFTGDVLLTFLKILCVTFALSPDWLSKDRLEKIISAVNCKGSAYILMYGRKYIEFDIDNLSLSNKETEYYIKFLTLSWLRNKS